MNDHMPMPNIRTEIQIGGFTLVALAYRTLTRTECKMAASMYLRQLRKKKFPATGSAMVVTQFGLDPTNIF